MKPDEILLIIDCTEKHLYCVLYRNGKISTCKKPQIIGDDNQLLNSINEILHKENLTISDCDYLGYINGPGSFTGIRIGASAIQALAYALNIQVVIFSKLQLLAQQYFLTSQNEVQQIALNALKNEVYLGVYIYSKLDNICFSKFDDRTVALDELDINQKENIVTDISILQEKKNGISVNELKFYDKACVDLACYYVNNNMYFKPESVLPHYLKMPHISAPKQK